MDYSSKLKVIRETSVSPEEAKRMIEEFVLSSDVLEGIQVLQLEEFLNNV
ncbi:ECU09_1665 [Encephalitozoon cuniculi GB-M1]|uniref:ECU09_1665 protein n=1 Tax=Encephalitozoon cuniculi (strain GB-M1) TaxID=284813 RepID=A0A1T5PD77_ENCCU|nr:uncharacterized protein ECU09_1665 [Encephalitozoon cuniculi GB-M1]UYI26861.1 hypothetical protein J0A71_03g06990 [Encephalitozoon cuniculi]SKD10705.1 ECU09_1665 [Encephalitozoon cuniculi GB-M1]